MKLKHRWGGRRRPINNLADTLSQHAGGDGTRGKVDAARQVKIFIQRRVAVGGATQRRSRARGEAHTNNYMQFELARGETGFFFFFWKAEQRVSPFLTWPTVVFLFWRDARVVRYNPETPAEPNKTRQLGFKHSRGGPITEQTTGDRKEKIGDHKEDLRQKPHDHRRQSTYLHAVPERRCPSVAGPWCLRREKFRSRPIEVTQPSFHTSGGVLVAAWSMPAAVKKKNKTNEWTAVLLPSSCWFLPSSLLGANWIFKHQRGR